MIYDRDPRKGEFHYPELTPDFLVAIEIRAHQ